MSVSISIRDHLAHPLSMARPVATFVVCPAPMDLGDGRPYLRMVKTESDHLRTWHCLQCTVPASCADDFVAVCHDLGSCGSQSDDAGPGVRLSAYFPAELPLPSLKDGIRRWLQIQGLDVELRVALISEQDWGSAWRQYFRPVWATPRIVLHPPWFPVDVIPPQISVLIDPKMAFGTGGHESTRLCLRALEQELKPGDRCFDLGTGSGVLSIAAAKLGAASVLGVDVDPPAIDNARENQLLNAVDEDRLVFRQGSVAGVAKGVCQLVMANIQSSLLRPLLKELGACTVRGGTVLMSGILARERGAFVTTVETAGMMVRGVIVEGEWICITAASGGC